MKMFIHLLVSTLAIVVATYLIPGTVITLTGAVVLGAINVFIKPAVKLIALPLTILTLGIFSLIINALFIMLAAAIVPGFSVAGFWTAFWFSIVLSIINAFFNMLQDERSDVEVA